MENGVTYLPSLKSNNKININQILQWILRGIIFASIMNLSISTNDFTTEVLSPNYDSYFQDIDVDNDLFPPIVKKSKWGKIYNSRIWCYLPMNLPKRSYELYDVMITWGKTCEVVLVALTEYDYYNRANFSQFANLKFAVLKNVTKRIAPTNETFGVENGHQKNMKMLRYLNKHHRGKFDWIFKLDDDTWVCYNHLKQFLQYYDPSKMWYIGQPFTHLYPEVYNAGGAGIALSSALISKLATKSDQFLEIDSTFWEDRQLGKILKKMDVFPQNTLTYNFQHRFHQRRSGVVLENENKKLFKNNHPKELLKAGNETLFWDTSHITFHWYKIRRRQSYNRLSQKHCEAVENMIPPLPRRFLFNHVKVR